MYPRKAPTVMMGAIVALVVAVGVTTKGVFVPPFCYFFFFRIGKKENGGKMVDEVGENLDAVDLKAGDNSMEGDDIACTDSDDEQIHDDDTCTPSLPEYSPFKSEHLYYRAAMFAKTSNENSPKSVKTINQSGNKKFKNTHTHTVNIENKLEETEEAVDKKIEEHMPPYNDKLQKLEEKLNTMGQGHKAPPIMRAPVDVLGSSSPLGQIGWLPFLGDPSPPHPPCRSKPLLSRPQLLRALASPRPQP